MIRKAAPDFALVAWALHMELRNGDRNAVSKPIALRGGATMALEVVAFRRDGFDGDIELAMDGLPEGVTAHGLENPGRAVARHDAGHGQSERAAWLAPTPRSSAGPTIDGKEVTRPCRLASMAWPIPDSWSEIPSPRLLADVPVSVSGFEFAPLTHRAADRRGSKVERRREADDSAGSHAPQRVLRRHDADEDDRCRLRTRVPRLQADCSLTADQVASRASTTAAL